MASLSEIKSVDTMLIEFFEERFKFLIDHITDMTDAIATTNINCHVTKNSQVRTIFKNRKRLMENEFQSLF